MCIRDSRRVANEDIASESVKQAIKKLIDEEDKKNPLSDQAIVEFLKRKEGIQIARRTVAKYLEKLKHEVEARISSGGERYEAHEATQDMYESIDKVMDKLERQIRGSKGAAQVKKRRRGGTG